MSSGVGLGLAEWVWLQRSGSVGVEEWECGSSGVGLGLAEWVLV